MKCINWHYGWNSKPSSRVHDAHRLVGIMALIVGTSLHPAGHLKERELPLRLLYQPSGPY